MATKSLTEKMLEKKAAEDAAKAAESKEASSKETKTNPPIGGVDTGMQSSVENVDNVGTEGSNTGDNLGNIGLVTNGDPDSVMGQQAASLTAGLAANADQERENEIALKAFEGEQRRQRMLEGRPTSDDLAAQEAEDAPEGGYKSNGITRFSNSQGNWVNAVKGYFVPQNEDEFNILEHYVKTGVVEAPKR